MGNNAPHQGTTLWATLWTTKEVAEVVGVDPSRIRQLLLSGELRGVKFGRDWLIEAKEAHRFIEERQASLH